MMSDNGIGSDEITQYLDSQSDFTLEMKVLSHTKKQGFQTVEHGGTYEDPVTKLSRQFDIRAKAWSIGQRKRCIKLAVECKALSKDFPLVIQRIPRPQNESYHEIYHAHDSELYAPSVNNLGLRSPNPDARLLRTQTNSQLYPADEYVGKSSNQIGRKRNTKELHANDKEIYNKWSQAIASAYDLIFECSTEREQLKYIESYTIVLPVLVVPDSCLWAVDYNLDGERISSPKQCDHTSFFIGKEHACSGYVLGGGSYNLSHLEVMTLSGYKTFTQKISSNGLFWDDLFMLDRIFVRN